MADALVSGASVRKDVEVQLLSAAPTNRVQTRRASASLGSMNEPLFLLAGTTTGVGIAALITGRPFHGWPRWNLRSRAFRLVGAFCAIESTCVVVLAQTGHVGIAWILFALGSLSVGGAVMFVERRAPST